MIKTIAIIYCMLTLLGLAACSTAPPKLPPAAMPSAAPIRRAVTSTHIATQNTLQATQSAREALDKAIVEAHQAAVASQADYQAHVEGFVTVLNIAKQRLQVAEFDANQANQRALAAQSASEAFSKAQEDATVRANKVQEEVDQLRQDQLGMHRWHGLGAVVWGVEHFFVFVALWVAGFALGLAALSFFVPAVGIVVGGFFTRLARVFFPVKS